MRWRRVLVGSAGLWLSLLLGQAHADALTLNGWHACTMDVGSSGNATVQAECATVAMPLCHGDVCSDSDGRTVQVFVKRIPANSATSTRNLWFVPDHPVAMSAQEAEQQMILIHQQLLGDVSVYLMDQRGTGRGTLFDCEPSQATAKTSPLGVLVAPSEVAACTDALHTAFGEHFAAAFSLTSAARDVVTFISAFQAKTKVFLYGVGVGTLLVERAMHFPSDEIIGFIFDSPMTTSGGKKKEFPYRSRRDKDFGAVAKAFLTVCDDDATCAKRFHGEHLGDVLQKLLDSIDETKSSCTAVAEALQAASTATQEPASYALRRMLATMLQQPVLRPFIPVLIYRLRRCNANDFDVVKAFITHLQTREDRRLQSLVDSRGGGAARLVYDLIQFSEMWEEPSPSRNELLTRFATTLASDGLAYDELERYCAFTKDPTSACSDVSINSSWTLSYSRDANWNTAPTIKAQASVLVLASRYDGHAPMSYAQTLVDAFKGDSKQLLVVDAAAHNVLVTTPLVSNIEDHSLDASSSCIRSVLASFIDNDGDLGSLDTTCMAQLPKNVSLAISEARSIDVLGVEDPYDGSLPVEDDSRSHSQAGESGISPAPVPLTPHMNSSIDGTTTTSLEKSRNRYRTAFIVLLVLAILLVVVVAVLLYRARKKRLLEAEEIQLRRMRGEGDVDDMEFLRDLYNPSPSEWFNYRSNRMHL